MSELHSYIENIWWSKQTPPLYLRLFEPIYRTLNRINLSKRASSPVVPPLPLISIGNITVGGSGKTPFVIWLARSLQEEGYKPVVLCRGDGGDNRVPILVEQSADPRLVGDEARLLANVSGCPVIAAKDRLTGCRMAEEYGNLIILDDGFQYRHLHRNCDIVLVPASGIGNGHQIPAGPLREQIAALDRADIIIRSGNRSELASSQPLSTDHEWQWISESAGLVDINHSGAPAPVSVYAATAIARPQRFFDSLETEGIKLSGCRTFPDHHRFSQKEIDQLLMQENVAVTGKDAVKLEPYWPKDRPLWLLKLQGSGEPGLLQAIISQSELPSPENERPQLLQK